LLVNKYSMCGILCVLNNDIYSSKDIEKEFEKGKGRGPDNSQLKNVGIRIDMGFHRLAINGLNDESNQPFFIDNIYLICNGEIYNHKELFDRINIAPKTQSDCEVIIHLYKLYGIEQTLQMLDGVFSFVLFDANIIDHTPNKVFVARDPYGVRPLYMLDNSSCFMFSSELKMIQSFSNETSTTDYFNPGYYMELELPTKVNTKWEQVQYVKYHSQGFHSILNKHDSVKIYQDIQYYFLKAIEKRCNNTDKPIACLLSGGLDSSLVTALVNEFMLKKGIQIETYSIGLKGSEDLKYAKSVADYLQTKHTEIIVTNEDFLEIIPEVIYSIESYDTTTIRASLGNYLLGKYISKHSECKVIFNGDGADELMGGYLYFEKCPDCIEFDKECRRLLKNIHMYDVLRSDKCISSHGLEPRTPYLDRSFVQYYLSIDPWVRYSPLLIEKQIIRNAFSKKYFMNSKNKQILPNEILWRKKEAFSDGVSSKKKSLFTILQENIVTSTTFNPSKINPPKTKEQHYYRDIFDQYYPNCSHLIPEFWMPKYIDATDPSARTLIIYK
jgi:asparagine synthase (glutamine-hydrolysing)